MGVGHVYGTADLFSMQSRLGPSDPRPARSSRQGRQQQPSHEHSTELLPPPIGHKQTPEDVPHLVLQPPVPPVRPPENLVTCLARAVEQLRGVMQDSCGELGWEDRA